MINLFRFWNNFSNSRYWKDQTDLLKDIQISMEVLEKIKKKIPDHVDLNNIRDVKEELNELLDAINNEEQDLFTIEKYFEAQDQELIAKIEEEQKYLKLLQKQVDDPEISNDISKLNKLKEEVNLLIDKEHEELEGVKEKQERFLKYTKLLGLHYLLKQIRQKEKSLRQEMEEEHRDISSTEHIMERLANDSQVSEDLKQDIFKFVDLFYDASSKEAHDIFTLQHDGFILLYNALRELEKTRRVIERIQAFDQEAKDISTEYKQVKSDIDRNLSELEKVKEELVGLNPES